MVSLKDKLIHSGLTYVEAAEDAAKLMEEFDKYMGRERKGDFNLDAVDRALEAVDRLGRRTPLPRKDDLDKEL